MWKYNKEKHSVDEQPTIQEPVLPINNNYWNLTREEQDKFDEPFLDYRSNLTSLRSIPVQGKVDWKNGEDVTGKFCIETEHPGLHEKDFAIMIK